MFFKSKTKILTELVILKPERKYIKYMEYFSIKNVSLVSS